MAIAEATDAALAPPTPEEPRHGDLRLTPRELEVLGLLASGRTNAEIAEALFISRGTARIHVSNILGKLGARTRTEAADLARRQGLV